MLASVRNSTENHGPSLIYLKKAPVVDKKNLPNSKMKIFVFNIVYRNIMWTK